MPPKKPTHAEKTWRRAIEHLTSLRAIVNRTTRKKSWCPATASAARSRLLGVSEPPTDLRLTSVQREEYAQLVRTLLAQIDEDAVNSGVHWHY